MMFLLGRQAMFGHDPPISPRSTTAVRWPAFAIVQARYLPASPLPMIKMSNSSLSGIAVSSVQLGNCAESAGGDVDHDHQSSASLDFDVIVRRVVTDVAMNQPFP